MAKIKTSKTDVDVMDFLDSLSDEKKKSESLEIIKLMAEVTGEKPYMYGPSIIGFGNYHYKYASGHEGDAPLAGFSPRKTALSLYVAAKFPGKEDYLKKLGKCKTAVACIYVKKLEDIDLAIYRQMVKASIDHIQKIYPGAENDKKSK